MNHRTTPRTRMSNARWAALLTTLPGFIAHSGCSDSAPQDENALGEVTDDRRREALTTLAENIALPTYREFAARAGDLREQAASFCANPTLESLTSTQEAWSDARAPWKRSEAFALGPYQDDPPRLGPKIDFWPARTRDIERVLADTKSIDQAFLDGQGVTKKGLPVIEYVLFDAEADEAAELERFQTDGGDRRCAYLVALTEDLAARAEEMVQAWDPGDGDFAGEIVRAGEGSEYFVTLQIAVNELFNQLTFTAENIRELKIGKPQGKRNGGNPQPDSVESRFSHRSAQDIVNTLEGLRAAYTGDLNDQEGVGFEEVLAERIRGTDRESLSAKLEDQFERAISATETIEGTFVDAVEAQPEQVEAAYQEVKTLHRLLGADASNVLGVTVMFNNTDAD